MIAAYEPRVANKRILVINPNSTDAVTRCIDGAVAPLRVSGGPLIECITLAEGPPGIETQRDVEAVVEPLLRLVSKREREYDAFVVACYSDPGVYALRELTRKPVLGIAECGLLTALTFGYRIGVIAILEQSIPRHLRLVAALGLNDRLAGELALGLGIDDLKDTGRTLDRMRTVGRRLRKNFLSDVVVMGCAGLSLHRKALQESLGVPVVDPCQAAVAVALGRILCECDG